MALPEVCQCPGRLCIITLNERRTLTLDEAAYYRGVDFRSTWTINRDCPDRKPVKPAASVQASTPSRR